MTTLDNIQQTISECLNSHRGFSLFKSRGGRMYFGWGQKQEPVSHRFSFSKAPYLPQPADIEIYQHKEQLTTEVGPVTVSGPQVEPSIELSDVNPLDDIESFQDKIKAAQEEIRNGRFYVLNLTTRFDFAWQGDIQELMQSIIRELHGSYLNQYVVVWYEEPELHISITPELFVEIDNEFIRTEPIKGTVVPDAPRAAELGAILSSEKERAEHLMIVDLLRNDIGRLANFDSVAVTEFQKPVQLANITHTYSRIEGKLNNRPGKDFGDTTRYVLQTMLPGGSVTGTPKHEVVNYLKEVESFPREYYTGCFGVLDEAEKAFESALLIRYSQLNTKTGRGIFGSGGGITIDSDPQTEWQEIHWKFRSVWEHLTTRPQPIVTL